MDLDNKKWTVVAVLVVLFLLLSSPFMYRITNELGHKVGVYTLQNGAPSTRGIVIHSLVFGLAVLLLMKLPDMD